ncbi:bacterial proteasome activator family protein [Arthrobacter sp. LAPM80]|uniref:bacterial proteasome activator family protein n=1 Tax=Arthrobacter sp. LAPM80 TaxID=3141788 RepID=UPI00398A7F78
MSEKAQIPASEDAAVGTVLENSTDGGQAAAPAGAPVNPKAPGEPATVAEMVDRPAKVMRIGTMVKQLLDEVKSAPLDDAARTRLAEIHQASIKELEDGLAPELVDELHRLSLPFAEKSAPSDAELRIAQAQLVGWLEGLFHGIQTALAAQATANQQTAARLALHQLPPGTVIAPGVVVGENGEPRRASAGPGGDLGEPGMVRPDSGGPGQYL